VNKKKEVIITGNCFVYIEAIRDHGARQRRACAGVETSIALAQGNRTEQNRGTIPTRRITVFLVCHGISREFKNSITLEKVCERMIPELLDARLDDIVDRHFVHAVASQGSNGL
jgi:hypothetical protein